MRIKYKVHWRQTHNSSDDTLPIKPPAPGPTTPTTTRPKYMYFEHKDADVHSNLHYYYPRPHNHATCVTFSEFYRIKFNLHFYRLTLHHYLHHIKYIFLNFIFEYWEWERWQKTDMIVLAKWGMLADYQYDATFAAFYLTASEYRNAFMLNVLHIFRWISFIFCKNQHKALE